MKLLYALLVIVVLFGVHSPVDALTSEQVRGLRGTTGAKIDPRAKATKADSCFFSSGGHQGLEEAGLKGKGNDGLNAEFAKKVNELIQELKPHGTITISSGYRPADAENARFDRLMKEKGCTYNKNSTCYKELRTWYPCPKCADADCKGQHHLGTAADLSYNGVKIRQGSCNQKGGHPGLLCKKAHELAGSKGMSFCLKNEPWHITLGGGGTCGNEATNGGPPPVQGSSPQAQPMSPAELKELLKDAEVAPSEQDLFPKIFDGETLDKTLKIT